MDSFVKIMYLFLGVFLLYALFQLFSFLYINYRKIKRKVQQIILKKFMKKEGILYVSLAHENFLLHKLKKMDYFINFVEVTEESEKGKRENYLMNLKPVFEKLISKYEKKKISFQVYFVSFLEKYPIIYNDDWNKIVEYLIQCCSSKSIYLRESALSSLYKIGNESYLEEALRNMNYLKINHPTKLLTDGFIRFEGSINNFAEMLKENISNYSDSYKISCLEYFSYQKIDFRKGIFQLLSSPEETKEVKLACIRYFANSIYEPVSKMLYELLKEDQDTFEYAAVAANVLKSYPSKETLKHLVEALRSKNWYVRNNAACAIVSFATEKELESLKNFDDKYGREALMYHISMKKDVVKCQK